jgi:hypothetical protein
MLSSRTYANATQIDSKNILLPVADAKILIAEQASLTGEVKALKEALALERESNTAILKKTEEYINASLQETKLLREQNSILQEQVILLNKKVVAEKAKGITAGIVIGIVVGIIASASM